MRNFISGIADQFPALTVKFIHGAPPDILWLNEFGQEVGRDHLDDYSEKVRICLVSSLSLSLSSHHPNSPHNTGHREAAEGPLDHAQDEGAHVQVDAL